MAVIGQKLNPIFPTNINPLNLVDTNPVCLANTNPINLVDTNPVCLTDINAINLVDTNYEDLDLTLFLKSMPKDLANIITYYIDKPITIKIFLKYHCDNANKIRCSIFTRIDQLANNFGISSEYDLIYKDNILSKYKRLIDYDFTDGDEIYYTVDLGIHLEDAITSYLCSDFEEFEDYYLYGIDGGYDGNKTFEQCSSCSMNRNNNRSKNGEQYYQLLDNCCKNEIFESLREKLNFVQLPVKASNKKITMKNKVLGEWLVFEESKVPKVDMYDYLIIRLKDCKSCFRHPKHDSIIDNLRHSIGNHTAFIIKDSCGEQVNKDCNEINKSDKQNNKEINKSDKQDGNKDSNFEWGTYKFAKFIGPYDNHWIYDEFLCVCLENAGSYIVKMLDIEDEYEECGYIKSNIYYEFEVE